MTKAQLIKENEALRKALRIVCTEPNSMDAYLIRGTEKHHVAIEKIVWAGDYIQPEPLELPEATLRPMIIDNKR